MGILVDMSGYSAKISAQGVGLIEQVVSNAGMGFQINGVF